MKVKLSERKSLLNRSTGHMSHRGLLSFLRIDV